MATMVRRLGLPLGLTLAFTVCPASGQTPATVSAGTCAGSGAGVTACASGQVATLASGGDLGTSFRPAGSSHGSLVRCAAENGTCALPAGTLNTVWYTARTRGASVVQTGLGGTVDCTSAVFGDPGSGTVNDCWYVSTSGVNSGNTGALTLRPYRFELTATAACPSGSFTYAGQPYTVTVTARNAAGGTTLNYDGTTATSASAITLASGRGTLTLGAPTPANASLSVDLALDLGSTAADQSCQARRPATAGAARPWLRSAFGSCATTADRDPAACASFGVFSPETRKTVHVRDIF